MVNPYRIVNNLVCYKEHRPLDPERHFLVLSRFFYKKASAGYICFCLAARLRNLSCWTGF